MTGADAPEPVAPMSSSITLLCRSREELGLGPGVVSVSGVPAQDSLLFLGAGVPGSSGAGVLLVGWDAKPALDGADVTVLRRDSIQVGRCVASRRVPNTSSIG